MYLTYNFKKEGVGAQYQRIIGLLAIVKIHNLKYIHNKITTVDHNYNNDQLWNDKWDDFFNIKSLSSEYPNDYTVEELHQIDHTIINNNENIIYKILSPYNITDVEPNKYYKSIQDDIRIAYDKNNKDRQLYLYNKEKMNIAIHIRVFNEKDDKSEYESFLYDTDKSKGRFMSECNYISLINFLKIKYPNSNIHIFSQSNIYMKYKSLTEIEDINLHIDIDHFDTFHHLCNADILVMAKSSFSYVAGLYNKNKVIYTYGIMHPKLDNWDTWDTI
jgi:hypothetical protein